MAIKQKLLKDDESNFYKYDFNDVYFKIDMCDIDIVNEQVRIGLRGYADKAAREREGMGIYKKVFNLTFADLKLTDFTKDAILTASYKYIMVQDDFKNGVKC